MIDEKTRLSYWYPVLAAADDIPVPKTEFVPCLIDLSPLADGQDVEGLGQFLAQLRTAAVQISTSGPWFLRTDFTSAKHRWKISCDVERLELIGRHVYNIVEESLNSGMIGVPTDMWVVREMLPTRAAFTAFRGMPIVREFRFFVDGGKIKSVQPYWPAPAIEEGNPSAENWRDLLAEMSRFKDASEYLHLVELVRRVSFELPGFWSVDVLETDRGWFVTDLAEGNRSFRYEPEKGWMGI